MIKKPMKITSVLCKSNRFSFTTLFTSFYTRENNTCLTPEVLAIHYVTDCVTFISRPVYMHTVIDRSRIGLITVSDAILTGRQSGQKLQCLYGNPMAKNFFQNRILHKL